jgi:hypothetical protein
MTETSKAMATTSSATDSRPEADGIDRRQVLATATTGLIGALIGASGSAAPAGATSGLGFVGAAQAQDGATPVGAKWWPSRFGAEDQAGASNLITPEKILDALKLIRRGKVYEIGRVYESSMPKFGERAFTLRIPGNPSGGPLGNNRVIWNDEFLATEIGQVGTQFDGLGHIGVAVKGEDKAEMRFYNGFTASEIGGANGLKKLGIESVRPIITRGWLFDMAALKGRRLNLGEEIKVADIEGAIKRQGINAADIKAGDALFFHTGWGQLWGKDNIEFGKGEPGIGMEAGQWCIKQQPCVVGADTWGVEVVPNPDKSLAFPVHQEFITKNGIFIHENLDFADLAKDTVNSFVYVMLPLRIKGATGSPGRPLAIV